MAATRKDTGKGGSWGFACVLVIAALYLIAWCAREAL